jgi:hypothetical protein
MTVMTGPKGTANQPFFMQVQLHGGKIRGAAEKHYEILEKRMVSQFGLKPTSHDLVNYRRITRTIQFF